MRRAGALIGALLVCASCTPSRVKPEADIDVGGTVQRQGSTAVAGARLALTREGDAGDVILTLATLGIACLDRQQAPAICDDARIATTDSRGRFSYHVKGKDTQSTFGASAVLGLTTRLAPKENEAAGSSTTYRFHVQTEKLDLPIRLWEPTFDIRTGLHGASVSYPRLPDGLLPASLVPGSFRYTTEFVRGNEIVWRVKNVQGFDPRLLEDSTGTVRVIASISTLHVSYALGQEVAIALRSGARAYESPLEPPASRAKRCSVVDVKGRRYAQSPCRLTDGTFAESFDPKICTASSCTEPDHTAAVIDLERRISVDLVVVRGCRSSCTVETSADGKTWRLAGIGREDQAAFPFASPRPARFVRVSGSDEADDLTEISAWSGRPTLPSGSMLVAPARFPTGQGNEVIPPIGKTEGISVWVVVAAGALGLAAGAFGFAVIKRRRPAA